MESRTYAVEGFWVTRTNGVLREKCEVNLTVNWSTFNGGLMSPALANFIRNLEDGKCELASWSQYFLEIGA
jgi:hypothetical protein